jgi:ABC-2 type transport system ATP-binding protein
MENEKCLSFIHLKNLGKKFNREWIFRNLNLDLESGQRYAFVGRNGSGKSTLLQVLSGVVPLTEGKIEYKSTDNQEIEIDNWYKHIVIAAPYLELIEEFTPIELLEFHVGFKSLKDSISVAQIISNLELESSQNKAIKYFSSGMKQRLKLALAFYSDVSIVMLDEPTSNLDAYWTAWYSDEVQKLSTSQIVLIASNVPDEYSFCEKIFNLSHH